MTSVTPTVTPAEELASARRAVKAFEDAHTVDGATVFSAGDLINAQCYKQLSQALDRCIEIDDEAVTLLFSYPYVIEFARLRTPLQLVDWSVHLLTKNWMPKDALKKFIQKVAQHKGWKLNLSRR